MSSSDRAPITRSSPSSPASAAEPARQGTSARAAPNTGLWRAYRGRVRGWILLLLCLMYFMTYVDRVNISTAAPFIRSELHLSNTQLGLVLSAFAIPYAFFQIFGGWLADRFGPRKLLTIVGVVWALATVGTGFATGLVTLFAARLALGFGEGAAFPGATHAMSRWLPADQRGFGQGVVHSFSRIGNAIAPVAVAAIIAASNWRVSFWFLGAVSLLWGLVWLRSYRDRPADHPRMTDAELSELTVRQRADKRPPVPWLPLLRRILPVTFVDFTYGWMLWVYLTWIPSFFAGAYHLRLSKFALFTTLVLLAGVVGDSAGGLLSDWLLRRTGNLRFARRTVLVVGLFGSFAFVMPTLFVHRLTLVTICLAVAFFFLELTNAVLWAIPMDVAPEHAGTAGGLMNTGFGIAGIVSPVTFGLLLDQTHNWVVPFMVSAGLLAVGGFTSLALKPERTLPVRDVPANAEKA
ncbi:MFS transporter [Amycolatopsis sp. K13G38]|uniref:MFS transporter n=1 Tax=Amycolatopsis acididurans TaxID=2724524 RepID=A0ABX1J1T1_9PSEU|nr:MFS transporter [Amycolatopsis acididurans]NKQ52310.1 MFS transporter [Amycolatopsis acididurans]